jgi:hypothetical protein
VRFTYRSGVIRIFGAIEFFKREAQRHDALYRVMIRNLVDASARQQQK